MTAPEGGAARKGRRSGTAAGLALVLLFAALPLIGGAPSRVTPAELWQSDVMKWVLVLVLLAVVAFWEDRDLASIGLRAPRAKEAAIGLGAGVGWLLFAGVVSSLVTGPLGLSAESSTTTAMQALPVVQKASVVLAAAVSEEVLFRGYLMERVEELTGRSWAAVLATVVLFVGSHAAHFGPVTNAWQTLLTLVFAGLYLWRRDLTAPIVLHLVVDAWGLILVPMLGS